ncbi:hypothetical protein MANES_02G205001v8 [Manihot esculenta]|uniref:Uncharacterized protein n=1 Tax=Manihot esculenta TaxID=3983 RepID=A0ACB7I777_MANES|nr:hypothetical protein MANES_02G205001v8 [Manihot esculenta]
MANDDIGAKYKDLGFDEVFRIGYYKPKGNWHANHLCMMTSIVKQMWEEVTKFGFLKLFIELKSSDTEIEGRGPKNEYVVIGIDERDYSINDVGEENVIDVLISESPDQYECPETEIEVQMNEDNYEDSDGVHIPNEQHIEEQIDNESFAPNYETDDEESSEVMQKKFDFDNGLNVDNVNGLGVDGLYIDAEK